jgi:hypothetical protein
MHRLSLYRPPRHWIEPMPRIHEPCPARNASPELKSGPDRPNDGWGAFGGKWSTQLSLAHKHSTCVAETRLSLLDRAALIKART